MVRFNIRFSTMWVLSYFFLPSVEALLFLKRRMDLLFYIGSQVNLQTHSSLELSSKAFFGDISLEERDHALHKPS